MNAIIMLVIVAAIVLFIAYKVKENKEFKEYQRKQEEEWQNKYRERKKNGEPSICENLPSGSENPEEKRGIGPDGKSYPLAEGYAGTIVSENFSDNDNWHEKYEYSPVFCMMAYELYVPEFIGRLKKAQIYSTDIRNGLASIVELAEGYAYPVPAEDDMTQAEYYTIRRLNDRNRAMEGNGYYKNAYGFPIDREKALKYFEIPELLRTNFEEKLNEAGNSGAFLVSRSWLQTAHLYSAGLGGVKKNVQTAIRLYSQAFQIAMHFSHEDEAYQIIHALTDGYPRNPDDYQTQAHNMLTDWACRTDFGLALYVEYIMHVEDMDRQALAKSPESVVQLCKEQAEKNIYAAYLLGRAMLYGYGTAKDEALGREIIEIAADSGCVSALYLLTQLSAGNPDEEKKWKDALDKTVAKMKEICGFMREVLQEEGMSVTQARYEEMQRRLQAEHAENQRRMQDVMSRRRDYEDDIDQWRRETAEAELEKRERKAAAEAAREQEWLDGIARGFDFPRYLYDDDNNPWELMNSGRDNATYYCQKTGQTVFVRDTDFEFGAPSGFHCR